MRECPAQRMFQRAFMNRVWEREERPGSETVGKAQAALVIFSAATLTRFEIGAKASL
jgi:hypothetical protein